MNSIVLPVMPHAIARVGKPGSCLGGRVAVVMPTEWPSG